MELPPYFALPNPTIKGGGFTDSTSSDYTRRKKSAQGENTNKREDFKWPTNL